MREAEVGRANRLAEREQILAQRAGEDPAVGPVGAARPRALDG
ncbi:MAG: hypothetical protein ACR2NR_22155 [Solirubrobacteraceae bacterium]